MENKPNKFQRETADSFECMYEKNHKLIAHGFCLLPLYTKNGWNVFQLYHFDNIFCRSLHTLALLLLLNTPITSYDRRSSYNSYANSNSSPVSLCKNETTSLISAIRLISSSVNSRSSSIHSILLSWNILVPDWYFASSADLILGLCMKFWMYKRHSKRSKRNIPR